MPVPTLSADQIEDIYTTTFNVKMPEVVDNVYTSNPTLGLLKEKDQILLDGGRRIEQNFIFGKLPGGSYGRGDTFLNPRAVTKTAFIIDWKLHRVELSIDGMDDLQNAGSAAAFDQAELKTQEAELTLKDNLGGELFGNGNNNNGNALNGLEEWIDDGTNFPTIGGIPRGTDTVGTAAKAVFNATGGSWTIPVLQGDYGAATIETEKINLILTTQPLWNALFNRVQPQQRYPTGGDYDLLAQIGFDALKFQRAAVVVDSHIQAGRAYGLNTNFMALIVHATRQGILRFPNWMPTVNRDERVNQLFWAGNVVVGGPRFQMQERNLVA